MSVVHTAVMHKILPAYVTYPIYKIAMNKIKGIITIKNQHKIMNNRKITNTTVVFKFLMDNLHFTGNFTQYIIKILNITL